MKGKAEQTKEAMLKKTSDDLIKDLKQRWPKFDRWVNFAWDWWKHEDKVHWPRFDGKGEAKGPFLTYSGRHSVPPPKPETQMKMIHHTWLNSLYLSWKIMDEELGREKASELWGYLWLAQVSPIVKLVSQMDEKDRNCLTVSNMYQQECYIEACDIDIVEESREKLIIRFLCNWWRVIEERWKAQGLGYEDMALCEPCIACCEYYGRTINPKISCTCTAHPLDTGSYCEMVYELKE